ncbi:lysosomal thioesterase PPT2-like [Cololabis saira]|uniref:lysosomal thioesterase PPT2-like n=1 Tax=Cololabis saira TaxID=129043 RepID=UPI002AD5A0DA|nr:lysosomal thioesterase PPT2-like [Cololabis saira]
MRTSLLALLLLAAVGYTCGYKPVVLVHGAFGDNKGLNRMKRFIKREHPGTKVVVPNLFSNRGSMMPMWRQIQGYGLAVKKLAKKFPNGFHLLCFSQGGLVCRGVLSLLPKHKVHNFIALASPLAGQFGEAFNVQRLFPNIEGDAYKICYNPVGQQVSICNYWKDPRHIRRYLKKNTFLPVLNGEVNHKRKKAWKKNFLRIKKLVLIGGPADDVITPWQSSIFGFYDKNKNVVPMRKQKIYKKDTFGLKTLDKRGDIEECILPKVTHGGWINRRVRRNISGCPEGSGETSLGARKVLRNISD